MAKSAVVVAASLAMVGACAVAPQLSASASPTDPVSITVDGNDIQAAASNRNGLTYKGFGVLSGNSTSALLMDYKAKQPEQYWELIHTLFAGEHPLFTAVKIEMGNDLNTSTGPEASTMRRRDEYPNVQREPGFQLAADAKKVAANPDAVHVSILRWTTPAWVNGDDSKQYVWYKNTVLAAYREYGYMVNEINPDINETRNPNEQLYKDFSAHIRTDTMGYEGATGADPNNGFRSARERQLFRAIRTVAGDTVGKLNQSFANALTNPSDASLRDAVDIVGTHYNPGDSDGKLTQYAQTYDKEIWNSEGQSTFGDSANRPNNTMDPATGEGGNGTSSGTGMGGKISGLEMANWAVTGFDHARRTANIWQPAIGSFYDGFQYSYKQLLNATDPWSGWIRYDGGLAVLAQFSKFAKTGWENQQGPADANGIWRAIPSASHSDLGDTNPPSGARDGNNSYMTLAAPDKSDFSTVIVNDSRFVKTYKIRMANLGALAGHPLEVWSTSAATRGNAQAYNNNYMKPISEATAAGDGTYTITVQPWSIATATTLDYAQVGQGGRLEPRAGHANPIPTVNENQRPVLLTDKHGRSATAVTDGYLYADDFNYSELGNEQTWDQASGRIIDSGKSLLDARGNKAKPAGTPGVQAEDQGATPLYSNDTNGAFESVATSDAAHHRVLRQQRTDNVGGAWNSGDPITTIGDVRWANYRVSADVKYAGANDYALIGARESGGTGNGQDIASPEFRVSANGSWELRRLGRKIASGSASATPGTNFRAGAGSWNTLAVQAAGQTYTAYINGAEVAHYDDPQAKLNGRIQLGSNFAPVEFDNLQITAVPGYTPYLANLLDDEHLTQWSDVSQPSLRYSSNNWNRVNTDGMYTYDRSSSKTLSAGATLTYAFTGTGLDLIGSNAGSAKLDVTVDNQPIAKGASTHAASALGTTYSLRGLPQGSHEVTLRVDRAGFMLDAVGVIASQASWPSNINAPEAADSLRAQQALQSSLAEANVLNQSEYQSATWQVVAANVAHAQAALSNPGSYGLDVEGANALADRIEKAIRLLEPVDISGNVEDLGLLTLERGQALPASLNLGGTSAQVVYKEEALEQLTSAHELDTVAVTGRSTVKIGGFYQRFSLKVFVSPTDLRYLINSGSNASGAGSLYASAKEAYNDLLNDKADQQWDGVAAGKTWGYSTQATTVVPGTGDNWTSSYLGADYNKPITYHLSLPAGSYKIGTVQSPRAGLQTKIYSSVTAPGQVATRKAAVSQGEGTVLEQNVTLSAPGIVAVEFGTDGTSGYNARLGLVYVCQIPRDLGYQGAVKLSGSLPSTVKVDGQDQAVTWNSQDLAQVRTAYEPLTVTGQLGSPLTRSGNQKVSARYEVVPDDNLYYYIDSGTNGIDSPQYLAVKGQSASLKNDKVDQVSTGIQQWGYLSDGMNLKGGTDINDKYATGMWQSNTKLYYRLPLEAGTYALTAGFAEWWGMGRTMNQTVSLNGSELARSNVPLSGSNSPISSSMTFRLDQSGTVEYMLTNEGAGSEKPVISWLAVAGMSDADKPKIQKEDLQAAIANAAKLKQENYTAQSWSAFMSALNSARAVFSDANATQAQVDAATQALLQAQQALVAVQKPGNDGGDHGSDGSDPGHHDNGGGSGPSNPGGSNDGGNDNGGSQGGSGNGSGNGASGDGSGNGPGNSGDSPHTGDSATQPGDESGQTSSSHDGQPAAGANGQPAGSQGSPVAGQSQDPKGPATQAQPKGKSKKGSQQQSSQSEQIAHTGVSVSAVVALGICATCLAAVLIVVKRRAR
ncbi:hypothetical protein KIM372_02690 [Bombiscardovia nodaiensis]|uniref:Sugar-binding protein n=1 Tax=Bombiscardovia nodaiensis TaxID=2932181 RepID=A0ABN6S884_9BIFI|nr:hypothetical protein KIM372_02690 [Bombiscardovia nodaiensis]